MGKRPNWVIIGAFTLLLGLTGTACSWQRPAMPQTPTPGVPPVVVSGAAEEVPLSTPTAPAPKPAPTAPPPSPELSEPGVSSAPRAIVVLPVPFMAQAPHANWDMPYKEACEEASMIMVAEYQAGNRQLRFEPSEADEKMLELVAWQEERGYAVDLTAAEVTKVLWERYGIAAQSVPYDAARMREELRARRPVIIPAAGRLLGNPYFTRPGPLYHMLVVRGYEGDEFIVNDPGTKRGENYRYHESTLEHAVHDWNGGDVANGERVMVILSQQD